MIKAKKSGSVSFTAILRGTGKRSANLIRFVERSISLAQLKKRKKLDDGKEIRFKIRKSGGLKVIKGSFVGNKGRTIFKRVEGGRKIKPVRTIDVPQMFNKRDINRRVQKIIVDKFPEYLIERSSSLSKNLINKSMSRSYKKSKAAHDTVKAVLQNDPECIRAVNADHTSDKDNCILTIATRVIVTHEVHIPKNRFSKWQMMQLIDGYGSNTTQ